MMNCLSCKTENRPNAKFCDNCGALMAESVYCRTCKSENPRMAKYCISCGTPFIRSKSMRYDSHSKFGATAVLIGAGLLFIMGYCFNAYFSHIRNIQFLTIPNQLFDPDGSQKVIQPVLPADQQLESEDSGLSEIAHESRDNARISIMTSQSAQLSMMSKVQGYWNRPSATQSGLKCVIQVKLLPSGDVKEAVIASSSGDESFDQSALNAVTKASPLPVPQDRALFDQSFRDLKFLFKPE